MKYIMLESKELGMKLPIIFPSSFVHSDVLMALRHLEMYKNLKPISAGEILINDCEITGKSETLGLSSNISDENTIELHDILNGID